MLVPNSTWVPPTLLELYRECCTRLLVPSRWCREKLEAYDLGLPIDVVPHGVDEGFARLPTHRRILRDTWEGKASGIPFVVSHWSTSGGRRKGTVELVEAWRMLASQRQIPSGAKLELFLDSGAESALLEHLYDDGIPNGVELNPRLCANPRTMSSILGASNIVCQPSRAEGFGLIPLEARVCGVPVVATFCSGHSEHLSGVGTDQGVVRVDHGPDGPIDDGPGALAPTVAASDIADSLSYAFENWPRLDEAAAAHAARVGVEWSWRKQLGPWIEQCGGVDGNQEKGR
jgi:glycosyltransferase involved in cell wall biosynthesis